MDLDEDHILLEAVFTTPELKDYGEVCIQLCLQHMSQYFLM